MLGLAVLVGVVLLAGRAGRGESLPETDSERFTREVQGEAADEVAAQPPKASVELGLETMAVSAATGAATFAAVGGAALGPVGAAVGAFVGWALMLGAQIWRDEIGDIYREAVRDALRDRGLAGTQTEVDEGILYLVLGNYPHELAYDPRTGQPGLVWQTSRTPESGSLDVTPGPGVGRRRGELDWHPAAFLSAAYIAGARRFSRSYHDPDHTLRALAAYDAHPLGTVLMGRIVRGEGSPGEKYPGGAILWTKNARLEFRPGGRTPPRPGEPDEPVRLGAPWRVLRPGDAAGLEAVMSWWRAHR